jgi:hypothetical protein
VKIVTENRTKSVIFNHFHKGKMRASKLFALLPSVGKALVLTAPPGGEAPEAGAGGLLESRFAIPERISN